MKTKKNKNKKRAFLSEHKQSHSPSSHRQCYMCYNRTEGRNTKTTIIKKAAAKWNFHLFKH